MWFDESNKELMENSFGNSSKPAFPEQAFYSEENFQNEFSEELKETGFSAIGEIEESLFGAQSAALGILAGGGAWNGKELGKWTSKNKDDYMTHRWGDAAKGFVSPVTTSIMAHKMSELKNLKERQNYRKSMHNARAIEAAANALTGYAGGLTSMAGHGAGVMLKMSPEKRRKF